MSGTTKSLYAYRKELGLCTACGKVPPQEGQHLCASCLEKRRINSLKYYNKNKTEINAKRRMEHTQKRSPQNYSWHTRQQNERNNSIVNATLSDTKSFNEYIYSVEQNATTDWTTTLGWKIKG